MCGQKEVLESMLCLFLERIFFLTSNHFSLLISQICTDNDAKQQRKTNKQKTFKFFSRPWAPFPIGNIILLSTVFDVLPVCVIKSSCAVLFKRNCQFSVHKCQNQYSKDQQIVLRMLHVGRQILRVKRRVLQMHRWIL